MEKEKTLFFFTGDIASCGSPIAQFQYFPGSIFIHYVLHLEEDGVKVPESDAPPAGGTVAPG